jgi:Fur family transcriptional regulator, peroxide stress response regulator
MPNGGKIMQLEQKLLRAAQLKVTPQRTAILNLLKDTREHPSVDKVHRMILKKYPSVSLATIYKTLELFKEKGLIQEVAATARQVGYDGVPEFHPHLVCKSCKKIEDMKEGEFPEELVKEASEDHGYQVTAKQVFLYGVCPNCQKN